MEKAKQAVSSFLSNDGKHRTTVDEDVKPHVTQETIKPHQHEQVVTALDKEVHQEHHHTTVQPIIQKETLPEQHHHNLVPVEHKTFHHGNEQETRATLDREAAKYRDTTETHRTTHSTETAPVLTGERIHHHVHEHVQPVIHKETVQPQVVHTTVPIHETHHAAPVHHGTSTLPAKSLEEFTQERGGLKERAAQKLTEFEGCPKPYRRELQGEQLEGDKSMHLHGHGDNYGENQAFAGREGQIGRNTEGLAAGAAAGAGAAAATRKHRHGIGHKERRGSASSSSSISSSDEESRGLGKSSKTKHRGLGSSTGTGVGAGAAAAAAGAAHSHHQSREGAAAAPSTLEGNRAVGSNTGLQSGSGSTGNMSSFGSSNRGVGNPNTAGLNKSHTSEYNQVKTGDLHNDPLNSQHARGDSGVGMQTDKKPSLLDRLNPMKDADGDGKKGLLD
ncbi:hypothetical protein FGADI_11918 [Fusarium gaditjirri]|uniref:Allergen n=1 Tax=Fusarium gaditjirri TaxID=282569 RepID=A0A8H4STU9_9HYPO|nr:hypothetical protein FGADI_11918 [Fusarium gaditjirri]